MFSSRGPSRSSWPGTTLPHLPRLLLGVTNSTIYPALSVGLVVVGCAGDVVVVCFGVVVEVVVVVEAVVVVVVDFDGVPPVVDVVVVVGAVVVVVGATYGGVPPSEAWLGVGVAERLCNSAPCPSFAGRSLPEYPSRVGQPGDKVAGRHVAETM